MPQLKSRHISRAAAQHRLSHRQPHRSRRSRHLRRHPRSRSRRCWQGMRSFGRIRSQHPGGRARAAARLSARGPTIRKYYPQTSSLCGCLCGRFVRLRLCRSGLACFRALVESVRYLGGERTMNECDNIESLEHPGHRGAVAGGALRRHGGARGGAVQADSS